MMDSTIEMDSVKYHKSQKQNVGLLIDIPTLKKLLNKTSCEFIQSLI